MRPRELNARIPLCTLQTLRQSAVGKQSCVIVNDPATSQFMGAGFLRLLDGDPYMKLDDHAPRRLSVPHLKFLRMSGRSRKYNNAPAITTPVPPRTTSPRKTFTRSPATCVPRTAMPRRHPQSFRLNHRMAK